MKTSPKPRSSLVTDAAAGGDVGHAAAEDAVDADDHLVARLDEVDDRASMPAMPVPLTASVSSLLVRNTSRKHRLRLVHDLAGNTGSRWPTVGAAIAASTRGWMSLGPGPIRMRTGGRMRDGRVFVIYASLIN